MAHRGRKSAASLAIFPNVTGTPPRLKPPEDLVNHEERALFQEIVGHCHPAHFRASDIPVLVSYVQATLMARQMARDPEQMAVWEKAVKLQAMLATRLRLTPASRSDPVTIARQQVVRKPTWEIGE
jgi:hypothetical protein